MLTVIVLIVLNGGTLQESYLAPQGNVYDTAGCSNYSEDQDYINLDLRRHERTNDYKR